MIADTTSLRRLVELPGPFVTVYLRPGNDVVERFRRVKDGHAPPAVVLPTLIDAEDDLAGIPDAEDVGSVVVVATPNDHVTIRLLDPIRHDLIRSGPVPSLGAVVESLQLLPVHAVVTVDTDAVGVSLFDTSPGDASSESPPTGLPHVIDHLRFARPRKIAVVGVDESAVEPVVDALSDALPHTWIDVHLGHIRSEAAVDDTVDDVVRAAATLTAETITHELGRYRAAAAANLVVEDAGVVEALRQGVVASVLVNDDLDDERTMGDARLVDLVVAESLGTGVPLTMTPAIDPSRGPTNGIGAILRGDADLTSVLGDRAALAAPGLERTPDRPPTPLGPRRVVPGV